MTAMWTEDEDRALLRHAGERIDDYGARWLADYLGRRRCEVRRRRRALRRSLRLVAGLGGCPGRVRAVLP